MFTNPPQEQIREILKTAKTIAVVGLSDKADRESYIISSEMQHRGYRIIPVNPTITEVLGEKSYPSLKDVPMAVDIVNVFRRSDALEEVVQEAIETSAPVLWAQQGVFDEHAAELAQAHHKTMIMDRCILVMHSLLVKPRGH